MSYLLMPLLFGACTDDTLDAPGFGNDGEPATIFLKVEVPGMGEATSRAIMDDDKETSKVNNLWIGIYNAATGERTYSGFFDGLEHTDTHNEHKVGPINTKSGRSYIVAVANSRTNLGVNERGDEPVALYKLLEDADTWDAYRSISVSLTEVGSVDRYTADFPMAGIYYDDNRPAAHPSDDDDDAWVEANRTPVFIGDGTPAMTGYIHLRRLHSSVEFTMQADKSLFSDLIVEPQSWRVVNVPTIAYLHEQETNSADAPDYGDAAVGATPVRTDFDSKSADSFKFSFYQMENKHLGRADFVNSYDDREKEYKNGEGLNTGVYVSLCPSVNETANNSASFVEINARVRYTYNGTPRVGLAKYTVHLGYCEGTGAERARDFRHRRNTKYTYNVKVLSLDKIVVEAEKEGEIQPGAEGDVTDMDKEMIELDCHYTMVNIKLSNAERARFEWRLRCPYDNDKVDLCSFFLSDSQKQRLKDNLFYTWVRILPAPNETTPAKYTRDAWYLEDLRDLQGHPHHTGFSNPYDTSEQWYTVFIDENTYAYNESGEKIDDKHWKESAWQKYVNKPNRNVWLGVDYISESPDIESTYSKAKYLISQKSIQTYYSTWIKDMPVIGVEHTNETFGKNMGWIWNSNKNNLSKYNGRYNLWQYLNNKSNGWEWSSHVEENKFLKIEYVNQQGKEIFEHNEYVPELDNVWKQPMYTHPRPNDSKIYEIISACMSRNRDLDGNGKITADEVRWYVPTHNIYLQMVMGADALSSPMMNYGEELVYPTGLPSYTNSKGNKVTVKKNQFFTRFHYVGSDMDYIFAEEGVSIGGVDQYDYALTHTSTYNNQKVTDYQYGFWELRCVRNLGTDITASPSYQAEVPIISSIDKTRRVISVEGLSNSAMRAPSLYHLPEHTIEKTSNRVSSAFEYAAEDCKMSINVFKSPDIGLTWEGNCTMGNKYDNWFKSLESNSLCGNYSQNGDSKGWRVPNQRELTLMRELGVFDNEANNIKWFSATREYYTVNKENMQRVMGVKRDISTAGTATNNHVRCVRDVIK